MSFFAELQRRNVVRVGIAYTVIAWVIAQVAEFAFESFGAPDWTIKSIVVLLLIGLPLALVFAWVYEMTPEGLKKERDVDRSQSITPQTGRRIDRVIIGTLVVALGFFAADKYLFRAPPAEVAEVPAEPPAATTAAVPGAPDKSVAVLPFIAMSDGPDDEFFADGLTEEILNSLAQLPELLVTARTSAFVFKGDDLPPIPEIAARLGVRHVVEGSVRRAGERLRVTAQLIRADDGFHLWSNNYDSTEADTIRVQEDIAERIALALDVVLDDEKLEAMRKAGLRDIEAFTAYQKGVELFEQAHGDVDMGSGLAAANFFFDQVIERVPGFADVYSLHSDYYFHKLNEDVFSNDDATMTPEEIEHARRTLIEDYQAAVANSRDRGDLELLEMDLAFVQGNWRGLDTRARRALSADVCNDGNWTSTIANTVGLAAEYTAQTRSMVACDPLRTLSWVNLARSTLWTGDAEEALRIAREGKEIAPSNWLDWVFARSLIESGRYEEAQGVIDSQMRDAFWAQAARSLLAAKQGDARGFATALAGFDADIEGDFFGPILYAWGGMRADANRMAARYDEHPWGPWVLWQVSHWCACGHLFDLEAAPNFARMIKESGLPWPPGAERVYPLKDW